MRTVSKLEVYLDGIRVGTLAPYQRYLTVFEYSDEWIASGFSISPFSLPLKKGIQTAKITPFDGLFGIFEDSLPDGWGRLLVDRMLCREGERPEAISNLQRLAIVGSSGMGALEYKPAFEWTSEEVQEDFDRLAGECRKILQSEEPDDLDVLFKLGGSSGGARPKILLQIDGEEWIVKFPSSYDSDTVGLMEYEYTLCAKECSIEVPEVRLFPSVNCAGYFGCQRFDRKQENDRTYKIHMASVSALLEVSHRIPALDYTSLMALTWQLTKNTLEVEKMYRLMCFNVFAHNRDDHSNNFSFLCENGVWRLAPAYDLTYSSSIGGEHATTVLGKGRNPSFEDLLKVGQKSGMKEKRCRQIAGEIEQIVHEQLGQYLDGKS